MNRKDLIKAALREMPRSSRRLFLRRSLSLGGLSLLTGCSVVNEDKAEDVLKHVSRFNDRFQAWLFDPNKLAPTYPESMITRPFPFNAFYSREEAPAVDADAYRLEVSGLVMDKHAWTLRELNALPQTSQVTRHICVEGWSAIGKWGGVPLRRLSCKRIGADLTARTSASNAPTTTTRASTCRRPCIRRRCSRSPTTARRCRASTASR